MPKDFVIRPIPQLKRSLRARLTDETQQSRNKPALVFAPHQDDECLGCGGTILLKREAGTEVTIVFMTDGATSHRRFVSGDTLAQIRQEEARQAAGVLGVGNENLRFLDFPDGRLGSCYQEALEEVTALIQQQHADEIFVPYRADGTDDHHATYRIVVDAARKAGRKIRVFEYPVWFWNQWPWVSLRMSPDRAALRTAARILRSSLSVLLLGRFRHGIFVGDLIEKKRRALEQHRSQTTQLMEGVDWPTLKDVSQGEFLNCFFQEFEVFHCWNT